MNQILESQQTSWASNGVSIVRILEEIDCIITALHCNLKQLLSLCTGGSSFSQSFPVFISGCWWLCHCCLFCVETTSLRTWHHDHCWGQPLLGRGSAEPRQQEQRWCETSSVEDAEKYVCDGAEVADPYDHEGVEGRPEPAVGVLSVPPGCGRRLQCQDESGEGRMKSYFSMFLTEKSFKIKITYMYIFTHLCPFTTTFTNNDMQCYRYSVL